MIQLSTTAESNKKLQAYLVEYNQGNEMVRHFDKIEWTIGSIFIPVSFALLGVSFTEPVIQFSPTSLIVLCVASFSLYGVFLGVDVRYSWFSSVAFERLRATEEELGIQLHTLIHNRDHQQPMRQVRTIRFLAWLVFVFLVFAWIVRFFVH